MLTELKGFVHLYTSKSSKTRTGVSAKKGFREMTINLNTQVTSIHSAVKHESPMVSRGWVIQGTKGGGPWLEQWSLLIGRH